MHPNVELLRSIKTFPQLVKYLRDKLDWPIDSDDFDDLTFDYEPEELGIDAKTAVKIKEIKQLRPLVSNQPWGIFFINFEPKQLPIVVLRRILRSLVVTKRSTAARAHQAAWSLHDLLFISSYGESEHRELTFAHFSEPQDRLFGDLPTLRVLGWDDDDTKLKIDHVAYTLSEKMRWPEDENDTEIWRRKWSDAFELRPRQVITTSKELAIRLADLARSIRQRANLILGVESERGPLRKLHKAFQTALIHDLNEDDFADMYAQTIAYGLLSEKLIPETKTFFVGSKGLSIVMNSFLSELLEQCRTVGERSSIDFDELGIQEVVDLLSSPDTHMEAVLRDFNKRTMQEDPVIHFYELFLKEYDKKKKVERGVFYTPQPVVSYIVRSVHELLKTEFGLEDGLASTVTWGEISKKFSQLRESQSNKFPLPHGEAQPSNFPLPQGEGKGEGGVTIPKGISPEEPFVQILDPATGTATFLVEVIEVIFNTMTEKWKREGHMALETPQLWNEYVPKYLLPRLYGFELMMAPYAIAHMKIGLKLFETGYQFGSDERAHIYLTNSMESPSDAVEQPVFEEWSPALAHEAKAVNGVKRNKRFTVVMGNPPYSYNSANTGGWISSLVKDYYMVDNKTLDERNPKGLQDDYVKFIRFGERLIMESQRGVLGYITNHGYLDNPTFRGMRQHIMQTLNKIAFLDLHGNMKKKEKAPDGSKDENVFDIQQGVALLLAVKTTSGENFSSVFHADLWGKRTVGDGLAGKGKYNWLTNNTFSTTSWWQLNPASPFYLFIPQRVPEIEQLKHSWKFPEIMPISVVGVATYQDDKAILFTHDEAERMVKTNKLPMSVIKPILYRPFDFRFIVYDDSIVGRPRRAVMRHMLFPNRAIYLGRQGQAVNDPEWNLVFCGSFMEDYNLYRRGNNVCFPLYIYSPSGDLNYTVESQPNINPSFIADLERKLSISFLTTSRMQNLNSNSDEFRPHDSFTSEDIFYYTYAIYFCPGYRSYYAEFLKIDFPRLPLTSSLDLFNALSNLGGKLVSLHLMESPKLDEHITQFIGNSNPEVEKVYYSIENNPIPTLTLPLKGREYSNAEGGQRLSSIGTVWIDKAKTQGFQGVPENVWNFHIGGYQVCEKWLKDRKGRTLSADDINHYHRIVVAFSETIRIMAEIDLVIEEHGGWPNAFMDKQQDNVAYKTDPEPLPKAAEETPAYIPIKEETAVPKSPPSSKDDWKLWLALSNWAKETSHINTYWIDFAAEISYILKSDKPLSDKQKENMETCWKQAVKKGFEFYGKPEHRI